jgi:hypothetical protein
MIVNRHIYLDEFKNMFKDAKVLAYNEPLIKVQIPGHGVFHLGELLTGSTRLMLILRNPPEKTYILIESLKHLHGVKLESGSFYAFARKDGRLYRFYIEGGKMKYQLFSK